MRNSLAFINESGSDALVKLVGPSCRTVEVKNGGRQTVNIAGGTYRVYVRYGEDPGAYRYSKGDSFAIHEDAHSHTRASLTLHGVVNGNYRTETSSENEFNHS